MILLKIWFSILLASLAYVLIRYVVVRTLVLQVLLKDTAALNPDFVFDDRIVDYNGNLVILSTYYKCNGFGMQKCRFCRNRKIVIFYYVSKLDRMSSFFCCDIPDNKDK